MAKMNSKTAQIEALLAERILILDGAMGTMIQRHKLGEAEYRGERFADWPSDIKGNNDRLSLTQPDIIGGIHEAYLEAGGLSGTDHGFTSYIYSVSGESRGLSPFYFIHSSASCCLKIMK